MKEKTQVADIDRSLYDFRYEENEGDFFDSGITPDIIKAISDEKNDPDWMREFRLKSLDIYSRTKWLLTESAEAAVTSRK